MIGVVMADLPRFNIKASLPVLLALALTGTSPGALLAGVKLKPARDRCTSCGCQILPGKAGRRCKGCRNAESASTPAFLDVEGS